jgi:hypothetical protein
MCPAWHILCIIAIPDVKAHAAAEMLEFEIDGGEIDCCTDPAPNRWRDLSPPLVRELFPKRSTPIHPLQQSVSDVHAALDVLHKKYAVIYSAARINT